MTVDLDGLTSGQTYYCKAVATNNNSNPYNCTFPGFGGVNALVTFKTATMKAGVVCMDSSAIKISCVCIIITNNILSNSNHTYKYSPCFLRYF